MDAPSSTWDIFCYIAGAVSIAGPLAIIYFYFKTASRRLKEFKQRSGE